MAKPVNLTPEFFSLSYEEEIFIPNIQSTIGEVFAGFALGSNSMEGGIILGTRTTKIQVPVSFPLTAGEDASAGDAAIVGDGTEYSLAVQATTSSGLYVVRNTSWPAQSFTTSSDAISIKKITINYQNANGFDSVTATVKIEGDSSNEPDGTALTNGTITSQQDTGPSSPAVFLVTYTFSTPPTVSPNTKYWIVIEGENANNNISVSGVASGGGGSLRSTDSGSNWGSSNNISYEVFEIDTIVGEIHRSDASASTARANNFLGFFINDVLKGEKTHISMTGIDETHTGLSRGSPYFLSDTRGFIATSAGSVSRKIGIAFSSTQLLIQVVAN